MSNKINLQEALLTGNAQEVSILLQKEGIDSYIDSCQTALMLAVRNGSAEVVKVVIDAGANPNVQTPAGFTALTTAVCKKDIGLVQTLLDAGTNVNMNDNSGNSPLMWAAYKGNAEIAQLFLKMGCDVSLKNNLNETALDIAREMKSKKVIAILEAL